jgi:hypothetical protein
MTKSEPNKAKSREEWDKWKSRIVTLYKSGMKISKLAEEMANTHNFKARQVLHLCLSVFVSVLTRHTARRNTGNRCLSIGDSISAISPKAVLLMSGYG